MPQVLTSNATFSSAPVGLPPDRASVVIDGVALDLDNILNAKLLTPAKVKAFSETFRNNKPFPHIVFEGLFSPELLELIYAEFDGMKWSDWRRYDTTHERKRSTVPNTRLGHAAQLYFNTIHSNVFVEFLQNVAGIESLLPDPTLSAGGLHEIPTGGRFSMHLDYNKHPVSQLDNRLVFITYLNKDWLPSYGGALELHGMDNDCKVSIDPIFGQSALFLHSSKSLHGHPAPVSAPNGRPRRSAAAYFYSNGRSDGETTEFHSTLFPMPEPLVQNEKLSNFIKYLTPPILLDASRQVRRLIKR